MRRLAWLALVVLAGCAHAATGGRAHATARLIALHVEPSTRGELVLLARYQLDGLPFGSWRGTEAQLTVSLDDVPFGAVVARPQLLPGDRVEVPMALSFPRAPREVAGSWASGVPVRVRLRGLIHLQAGEEKERVRTDAERPVVLPTDALPPPRAY